MTSYRRAPLSSGHDYRDTTGFLGLICHIIYHYLPSLLRYGRQYSLVTRDIAAQAVRSPHLFKSLLNFKIALILLWVVAIWVGEEGAFRWEIASCNWQSWENWVWEIPALKREIKEPKTIQLTIWQPRGADPHHVILIADPQLVDPHTYPGRPWPLSTMTRRHTDLYLRKSFSLLEDRLDPDTVFFLGDLFDGGREWLPPNIRITDNPWQAYGQDYWLKEYSRFGRIYFDRWHRGTQSRKPHQHGRKIIASLPGNHDLGLGTGIKNAVRSRFNAYFGDGNRIDIIGNHTFVSLDTVSLSAKGQPDPMTGQLGKPEGDDFNRKLWGPTDDFLTGAKAMKERLIAREIRLQHGQPETNKLFHEALNINDPIAHKLLNSVHISQPDIPSILLTHVPLYRAKGTPCGPLREHFPPSKAQVNEGETITDNDPPNAIKVEQGVQYQNVLTPYVSHEIIERVGDVAYAFSGDDHDYCDVVHRGYTSRWGGGGVREITVKSTSWAMGIRRPGFLMVSLWNPLEASGAKASSAAEEVDGSGNGETRRGGNETLQTHLCLLPDQLGIFIRYAVFFILTVIGLFVRSVVVVVFSPSQVPRSYFENANGHALPMDTAKAQMKTKDDPPPPLLSQPVFAHSSVSARSESPNANANGLAVRVSGRLRGGGSPSRGYALPVQRDMMHADPLDERWGSSSAVADAWIDRGLKRTEKGLRVVWREFLRSFVQVAGVGFGWWVWLAWGR